MTWRKLSFQKFKEGRKERLSLDTEGSGSVPHSYRLSPLKDQITQASTRGHNTVNITLLQRLLWLNKLGNTGCFICLNI